MKFGYARVSTKLQNLDRQIDWLNKQGCEEIFVEKESGTIANRPELMKMMDKLREGDTVYFESFSRLGRSTKDLIELVEKFRNKNVTLVSSKENFDTSTPQGMLMLTLFQALAQFERDMIVERTRDGLAAARARGRSGGRPRANKQQVEKALKMYDAKSFAINDILETCQISKPTLYRYIRKRDAERENAKNDE